MPKFRCPCIRTQTDDIRELDYRHCSLNDVPSEVFAFERTLEELLLDSNQIRDLPRPLFHCHGLKHLGLSDNEIQTLPPAVASLINLQQIDVSKNAISDFPDNIKGCKHLSVVEASVNPLGKLPEGFTQLLALEELYLNDTFLDYLPANFGRLSKLRILELRENHLNTLPKSLGRLTNLQRLDIGQNEFSELPEVIGNLPNLTELWCDCNKIKSIPNLIGKLKKLNHLDASSNSIDLVAHEIEGCSLITDITLTCNELQELPDTIGKLKHLTTLKLDDNQFATLPGSVGNLTSLEELILSQNDLESLPPSVGLLRKLHTLNIDDNLLEDLPPELGSCTGLTILSARGNKLTHIPAELGHIPHLRVINISSNYIQNLPFSIMKLEKLAALWLSDNQNKPLVPLNSDIDPETGQRVLTCFMLPQVPGAQDVDAGSDTDSWHPSVWEEERHNRTQIKFAFDAELDKPGYLLRTPTPYPKELKALAKHARNMQRMDGAKGNGIIPGIEKERKVNVASEGMVAPSPAEVKIKEAKVTKPQTSPVKEGPVLNRSEKESPKKDRILHKAETDTTLHLSALPKDKIVESPKKPNELTGHTVPAFKPEDISMRIIGASTATERQHLVKEAKYVKNYSAISAGQIEKKKPPDMKDQDSELGNKNDNKIVGSIKKKAEEVQNEYTSEFESTMTNKTPADIQTGVTSSRWTKSTKFQSDRVHTVSGTRELDASGSEKGSKEVENVTSPTSTTDSSSQDSPVRSKKPPPYHIAAVYSRHAAEFNGPTQVRGDALSAGSGQIVEPDADISKKTPPGLDSLLNRSESSDSGCGLERRESLSDRHDATESSESETFTAPSSLQTVIDADIVVGEPSEPEKPIGSGVNAVDHLEVEKTAEKYLGASSPTTRQKNSEAAEQKLHNESMGSQTSLNSAHILREVSKELLQVPASRDSINSKLNTTYPSSRPSSLASTNTLENYSNTSRPLSFASQSSQPHSSTSQKSRPHSITSQSSNMDALINLGSRPGSLAVSGTTGLAVDINSSRPGSYAGPPNTVGLPTSPLVPTEKSCVTSSATSTPTRLKADTAESPSFSSSALLSLSAINGTNEEDHGYQINETYTVGIEAESISCNDTKNSTYTVESAEEKTHINGNNGAYLNDTVSSVRNNGLLSTIEQVTHANGELEEHQDKNMEISDRNQEMKSESLQKASTVPSIVQPIIASTKNSSSTSNNNQKLFGPNPSLSSFHSASRIPLPKSLRENKTEELSGIMSRIPTFIQDKPSANNNIVTPTPQWPQTQNGPVMSPTSVASQAPTVTDKSIELTPPPTPPPRTDSSQNPPVLAPKPTTHIPLPQSTTKDSTYIPMGPMPVPSVKSSVSSSQNLPSRILKPGFYSSSNLSQTKPKYSQGPQPSMVTKIPAVSTAVPKTTSISSSASSLSNSMSHTQIPVPGTQKLMLGGMKEGIKSTSSSQTSALKTPDRQHTEAAIHSSVSSRIPLLVSSSPKPPETDLPNSSLLSSTETNTGTSHMHSHIPSLAGSSSSSESTCGSNSIPQSRIPTVSQTASGSSCTSGSRLPVSKNISTSSQKNKVVPQISNKPASWMFGQHKNPKVFPAVVHKNPGLGFSIAGGVGSSTFTDRPEDHGIYITKVHPNGPAGSLLRPGDKILQVDGKDFTALEHDEAVALLRNTGATVDMMISRQQ